MHKSFVAVAAATLVLTVPAESGVRRPVTLVRIPRHVNGFAQDRRYLAWTTSPGGCDVVTFRSFSTRRQVTVGPPPRGRSCAGSLSGGGGEGPRPGGGTR